MQNINIVYKVDKGDVDKSNAAVERAKQLTDQLKNASKQFSDQAVRGNKEFQGSIEGLKIKMAQLRAQIDLTSRSDSARLSKLTAEYKQVKKEVDNFNQSLKETNKIQQQATASTNSMTKGFMDMYGAIRAVIGAAVVRELVDITLEMARLNGATEAVGKAFKTQIPVSEALLYKLRKATHGTVGDLELMQRALKFQNFGGDVQRLPEMLEFAAVRAQQTGESIDYMVNSIVDGIGRKSLLKLDNLGISATRLKEEFKGVSLASLSVAEVTQGVANIMQEELESMGGYAETSADAVEQITVAITNLKIELAKKGDYGALLGFFKDMINMGTMFVKAMPDLLQWKNLSAPVAVFSTLKELGKNFDKLADTQKGHNQALEEYTAFEKEANKERAKALDLARQKIVQNVEGLNAARKEIEVLKESMKTAQEGEHNPKNVGIINAARAGIHWYEVKILKLEKLNELLREYIVNMIDSAKTEEARIKTIKDLEEELDALQKQRKEQTSIYDQAELDRLQRLILLKEEEIARVSDTIKYYKYWDDISRQVLKTQEQINEAMRDRAEGDAMEFFERMAKDFERAAPKLNIEIELEPEISPDGWAGGNEKMARFRLEMKKFFKENQDEIIGEGIGFTTDLLQTAVDAEMASYQVRLNNLKDYYDQVGLLAGDNERYKKELALREQRDTARVQREQAQAQKKARKLSIIIDTAASIARAWVNPGYPGAIPLSVFLAAQGATQVAMVERQPVGFKDGVINLKGPGTSKSDSIPARLSKGESVMTAEETKSSHRTLKMIRAKKLDDRLLDRLQRHAKGNVATTFDDSRMVEASKRIEKAVKSNDIVRKGSMIYEAKQESENFKRYIRSKTI